MLSQPCGAGVADGVAPGVVRGCIVLGDHVSQSHSRDAKCTTHVVDSHAVG